MNNLEFASKYIGLFSALADAINIEKSDKEAAAEVNKANATSTTEYVRQIVKATAEEGIPFDRVQGLVTGNLTVLGAPSGSVKACGNRAKGFRSLLDKGTDIANVSASEAQAEAASDEVKAKKEAKSKWAEHTKEWSAADWASFLEDQGIILESTAERLAA